MIAFDPDEIVVEDHGSGISADGKSLELRWRMGIPKQGGTAWFRIDDNFMNFLKLCHEKNGILGFEWDPEDPRSFGVVVYKDEDDEAANSTDEA